MGLTLAEQIISHAAGRTVRAGDLAVVPVDMAMAVDSIAPSVIDVFINELGQLDFKEYERVRSEGTKAGGNVLPTAEIDNVRYVISWDNYLTKVKAIPNVTVVGIPKTYFQSL